MKLTDEEIDGIIEKSIEELPEEFRRALDNIIITVEESPPAQKFAMKGIKKSHVLLGLYRGVPKTQRSKRYGPILPDYIAIYKSSIQKIAGSAEEAKELLRTTLLHELGHYFGLSEYDLRKRGY